MTGRNWRGPRLQEASSASATTIRIAFLRSFTSPPGLDLRARNSITNPLNCTTSIRLPKNCRARDQNRRPGVHDERRLFFDESGDHRDLHTDSPLADESGDMTDL